MIDGILIIDKQEGITSYDVIRKIKRKFDTKIKIGHAGTLDPFATGVLIILLGRATKLMESIHRLEKEYVVKCKLGVATDTQDITGEVVSSSDIHPTLNDIKGYIATSLMGEIDQMPPKYSAKKIDGKKAYELARDGKEFELKPKRINVSEFEVLNYEYPVLECKIKCSTGTYVRTLVDDLGKGLGCFATAQNLERTSVGEFGLNDSLSSKDLEDISVDNMFERVISVDKVKGIVNHE